MFADFRGTEPDQLALSAAVGFTLGIFPIVGKTIFFTKTEAVGYIS